MLVAPRISQGLGLPWSAFVCYSLPWSARVCLGCCCWHRMALNAWTYKWDGMEISVCVSSKSTAFRCSRPNLSYVLIVIIAFQLSGIGQAIKMDNLQQYVTLSWDGASFIFGHINPPFCTWEETSQSPWHCVAELPLSCCCWLFLVAELGQSLNQKRLLRYQIFSFGNT